MKSSKSVSPKVTASTTGGALSVVLAYLIGQVPFIASAPGYVQAAMVLLLVSACTFAAGYIKRDPNRF